MKGFSIGNRPIGVGAAVFLVAELSANHGNDKGIAIRTIEAAAKAGADAIKLQTYTPDTLTLKSDADAFVVKTKNSWSGRTLYDLYQEAMTPWEWHRELKSVTESLGMCFFSTPFDPTAVAFLEQLGVLLHKVASFELNDLPLVESIARTGKPMILSTGMATLGDIEAAVAVCRQAGNDNLVLLRCVSAYPAKPESMDLASFDALRSFGTVVGLSDHTRDPTVAIASVALGAKVIEKHFILDRSIGGPDSFFSLEPDEFRAMAQAVRDTERALGTPRFGPAPEERASTAFRRSIFVAEDVAAGEVLTSDSIRSVRPNAGLHPKHLPEVLGCTAQTNLTRGTPLTWAMVGSRPTSDIELRPATLADAELLLVWRNDATTRAMSFDQAEVTTDGHMNWMQKNLEAESRLLFMASAKGSIVGTIRFDDRGDGEWETSITIAPSHRGKGHAADILRAGESHVRSRGVVRIAARIRSENTASLRAFKKAGYHDFSLTEGTWSCARRLTPYP